MQFSLQMLPASEENTVNLHLVLFIILINQNPLSPSMPDKAKASFVTQQHMLSHDQGFTLLVIIMTTIKTKNSSCTAYQRLPPQNPYLFHPCYHSGVSSVPRTCRNRCWRRYSDLRWHHLPLRSLPPLPLPLRSTRRSRGEG